MKLIFTLILSLTISLAMNAQNNLVPNGSFETKDPNRGCPSNDSFSQGRPQYWSGVFPEPGDVSGDYFNPCAPQGPGYNYPGSNEGGCELPLDGQSYCGFLAFTNTVSPSASEEYIMNNNIQLTGGQRYYVEFYISSADNNPLNEPWSTAYSRKIGALFVPANTNLKTGQINGLNQWASSVQIPNTFPSQNYYQVTNGWQKISGYFTPATTGLWEMIIGNFDTGIDQLVPNSCNSSLPQQANPDLLLKPNIDPCKDYVVAYYYVDAVTVIPATQTPPSYLPYVTPNTPLCGSGTYALLNVPNAPVGDNLSVSWSVAPTSLFSGATSGNSATANLVAGTKNGSATLTYSISSVCGSYPPVPPSISGKSVDPVSVWVGLPVINSISIDGNSGPYPLCSSGTNITFTNMQYHTMVASTSGQTTPSVTYTLNTTSSYVTGSTLNATTYEFISNEPAKFGSPTFTITADAGNICGDVQQCLYFSNSGPCTIPQITSVTVNGVSGYDCTSNFVHFTVGTWYTIQVTDNTNTPVTFSTPCCGAVTQTLSSTSIKVKPTQSTGFSIFATTSNICGSTDACIWFGSSGPAPQIKINGGSLSVYPNPASSTFSVQLVDSTSTNSTLDQPFQVYMYNRMSQMVYSIQSWSKSTEIPVSDLPTDIYYLNVIYKNAVLQKQIVVKK